MDTRRTKVYSNRSDEIISELWKTPCFCLFKHKMRNWKETRCLPMAQDKMRALMMDFSAISALTVGIVAAGAM